MPLAIVPTREIATSPDGLRPTLAGTTQYRPQPALVPDTTTVEIPLVDLQIVAAILVVAIVMLLGVLLRLGRRSKQPRRR